MFATENFHYITFFIIIDTPVLIHYNIKERLLKQGAQTITDYTQG